MSIKGSFQRLAPGLNNKKGPDRLRVSNFMITLNTNVPFKKDESLEGYIEPLYTAAEKVFGDTDNIGKYVILRGGSGNWSPQYILSTNTTARVEVGANMRGRRLHLHVGLKIRHKAMIHLDIGGIQLAINEALQEENYPFPIRHIDVKAHKPSLEDYLYET